jgi:hypothetical protein
MAAEETLKYLEELRQLRESEDEHIARAARMCLRAWGRGPLPRRRAMCELSHALRNNLLQRGKSTTSD